MKKSALTFAFLSLIVALFQLALALGAPWGTLAMGGKYPGKLPPEMQIAALIQMFVILLFAIIVLSKARLILPGLYRFSRIAVWFVFAFFVLGTIMNLITPSFWERLIWAPVNLILLVSAFLIARKQ